MKRALLLLLLTPVLALGSEKITMQDLVRGPKNADEAMSGQPRVIESRANRVNRCVDARGAVVLSDLPCAPIAVAASAPIAVGAPDPEVVDITALQPRPAKEAPVRAAGEAPKSNFVRGLLHGSWKLALLVVALYALYRGARLARDRYRERFVAVEPIQRGAGPVRIR